jgi:hypothetical protein
MGVGVNLLNKAGYSDLSLEMCDILMYAAVDNTWVAEANLEEGPETYDWGLKLPAHLKK